MHFKVTYLGSRKSEAAVKKFSMSGGVMTWSRITNFGKDRLRGCASYVRRQFLLKHSFVGFTGSSAVIVDGVWY